jgi:small subunit ribosomal protein S7
MSRRRRHEYARDIGVDPVFGDRLVQKLIHVVMERGKKSLARSIVYGAMDILMRKQNGDQAAALELFKAAYQNVVPQIEVRSRRVGGGVYQIPRAVPPRRQESLALRWIVKAAKSRSNKTMVERLGSELFDASQNKGGAVQECINTRKMAEANRAFAHFAW